MGGNPEFCEGRKKQGFSLNCLVNMKNAFRELKYLSSILSPNHKMIDNFRNLSNI